MTHPKIITTPLRATGAAEAATLRDIATNKTIETESKWNRGATDQPPDIRMNMLLSQGKDKIPHRERKGRGRTPSIRNKGEESRKITKSTKRTTPEAEARTKRLTGKRRKDTTLIQKATLPALQTRPAQIPAQANSTEEEVGREGEITKELTRERKEREDTLAPPTID